VSALPSRLRRDAWGIASALFYFAAGQPFLPRLGIENDEALFASPILSPRYGLAPFRVWHTHFALMLMSYLGTLKTLILLPVIKVFGANVWSVREPMLLAGAASIWIFYLLVERVAGVRAARIGAVLLAADSLYLLTTCFDWGPVALQHLLLVTGMFFAMRFYKERRELLLAAAFCAFGLALWDKALAIWMLSGIAIAALGVFPREILALLSKRRLAIAAGAFLAGALPLVIYNLPRQMPTFHGNFTYDVSELPVKARMLVGTAHGGALLGFFNQDDWQTPYPHRPAGPIGRFSVNLSQWAGHPGQDLFLFALVLALLLAPFAWGRGWRALLFSLTAMALAWAQMAATAGAGGSAHHTILLWPLPQMFVAVSFAAAAERFGRARIAIAAAVAVVCASSLVVTNEYYVRMARNGGPAAWTDAFTPLNAYLLDTPATAVYCMDWGFLDTLRLLSMGKLPLREGSEIVSRAVPLPQDREAVLEMIADRSHVFVTHPPSIAFFHVADGNLARLALEEGYRRENIAAIRDSYGRLMFEVYRFQKAPASSPRETKTTP
jgi:4-amino-4-deoxy-L-arabinose transferase-like glycosyltransferase